MMEVNKFNKMVSRPLANIQNLEKDIIKKNKTMKTRQQLHDELDQVYHNIRQTESITDNISNSSYYTIYGNEEQRAHDVEIQNKCLEYWKRRYNRILIELRY